MNLRSSTIKLLAGVALLLALSAIFLSTTPAPPAESESARAPSRELDEAAEEVRAVATGMRRLEGKISDQAQQIRDLSQSLLQVNRRVEQWEQSREKPETPASESASSASSPTPAPALTTETEPFDMDSLTHEIPSAAATPPAPAASGSALVWIEPLDKDRGILHRLESVSEAESAPTEGQLRFFIPPAILSGLSLTALVGRIPRGGAVQDPWPFIVVSQADNLTANGVRLPHLRGILWRGVARGDAVLSCVSASIRSMVYVFDDGVFHVAKAPDPEGFGYLTDKAGNPCIGGEIHTTAPASMSAHLLAGIVAGAGGAFAQSQVRSSVSGGTETSRVEGDAFDYLLGQTVQGAATTYGEFLARYANDTWDAVVAPAGLKVDIHITDAIAVAHSPRRRIHETPIPVAAGFAGGLD